MVAVTENCDSISFSVKVHPRARKNSITGEIGGALKLALTAPPVDGAANEACVEFFAKSLKVRRSSVSIASGERSRLKTVRVAGVTAEQFWERISSQQMPATPTQERA
jgi:uncharacterized protein (TIGR00251 family)